MSKKSKVAISVSLILCVIFTVLAFIFRSGNNGILCFISFMSFGIFMMQALFVKFPIETMTEDSKVAFVIPLILYLFLMGLMFLFPEISVLLMFLALMTITWFLLVNKAL